MLNITDTQKELFYGAESPTIDYTFRFDDLDLTITNDILHEESVAFKESVCEDSEMVLGGCIASSMEFEVSEIMDYDLTGLEFTARIHVNQRDNGQSDVEIPMGRFRVESCKKVNDKDYKKVVAYDALYDASIDVSTWYDSFVFYPLDKYDKSLITFGFGTPGENGLDYRDFDGKYYFDENTGNLWTEQLAGEHYYHWGIHEKIVLPTLKEFRNSLLEYLGIPNGIKTDLPNDSITVAKTLSTTGSDLTGTAILKSICELHGGFGRINRYGYFEVITLREFGVYPEDNNGDENLYPEDADGYEKLYPEDDVTYIGFGDGGPAPEYRTVVYEEYMTMPITCISIKTSEEDEGTTIGDDTTNAYVIKGNFLLYGKTSAELEKIGGAIYEKIQDKIYRPCTITLDSLPYLECGDVVALNKETDSIETYIFSRTASGIQAMVDTYEAKGSKVRENNVSASTQIEQLMGKILKIEKKSDVFSVNLKSLGETTDSLGKYTESLGETTESLLEMTASNILLQVTSGGKVVAMTLDASGNQSTFSIEADKIDFTGKKFNLSTEKINIESDLFSVDSDGKVTAKSIDITGGTVNIDTVAGGESVIRLRDATYDNPDEEITINAFGHGEPAYDHDDLNLGESYLDLDTGKLWVKKSSGYFINVTTVDRQDILWVESLMDTEKGFYSSKYTYQNLIVPATSEEKTVTDSLSYACSPEGFVFSANTYRYVNRYIEEYDIEHKMQLRVVQPDDPQSEEAPYGIIECHAPFYSQNLKKGYIVKNITAVNIRFYAEVYVDMPSRPVVVATAETTNPSAVSVSVADVTESGFKIYISRSDTTGNIGINWIAMC